MEQREEQERPAHPRRERLRAQLGAAVVVGVRLGARQGGRHGRATAPEHENPDTVELYGRKLLFDFNFVEKPWPITVTNAQRWWSPPFLIHYEKAPIRAAIADRVELYSESFRRWEFRLAYEQLCFSVHDTKTERLIGGEDGDIPVMVLCGTLDNDLGAKIYDNSVALEGYLRTQKRQRGRAVWISGGHSIHDEAPQVLGEEVHRFLRKYASPAGA